MPTEYLGDRLISRSRPSRMCQDGSAEHHHGVRWGNPRLFLFFVPGKLMAALAYRDDKILARNLLSHPFFCLTPAEPFFRPDRSSTAPSCRVAVKDGRAFRGHPKGLSLTAASTMARWRYRSGRRPCVAAEQVSSPRRSSRFRFPFPQCLQKCGNSNREVHRLSRFSDHQTACSCSNVSRLTLRVWHVHGLVTEIRFRSAVT